MATNLDAIIHEGIAAFKAGRKDEARSFLLRAVELDQYSEQAWLWLSAVVDSKEDQRTCLENVLAINPENERARQGLAVLSGSAPPTPPTPAAPAPTTTDFPTSVEWADEPAEIFDEPPAPAPDLSDDDYDDWVANLNLPASSPQPVDTMAFGTSDPFGGAFFSDDEDEADDEPLDDLSGGTFGSSPFSTLDFETVFGSSDMVPDIPPPPPPEPETSAPAGLMSGGRASNDDPFSDIDLRSTGVFAAFDDDDEDLFDVDTDTLDDETLFQYIPADIKPTRLPGTRERYPLPLIIGLVLLLVLNAGALALLVYRLL